LSNPVRDFFTKRLFCGKFADHEALDPAPPRDTAMVNVSIRGKNPEDSREEQGPLLKARGRAVRYQDLLDSVHATRVFPPSQTSEGFIHARPDRSFFCPHDV
jgi:hypothetical protein